MIVPSSRSLAFFVPHFIKLDAGPLLTVDLDLRSALELLSNLLLFELLIMIVFEELEDNLRELDLELPVMVVVMVIFGGTPSVDDAGEAGVLETWTVLDGLDGGLDPLADDEVVVLVAITCAA